MNIYIYKIKKIISVVIIVYSLIAPLSLYISSYAAISGEVNMIVSPTSAYREPSMGSEKIRDLNIGDTVFVTGEDGDFYAIYFKDTTQYVPKYAIDGTDVPDSATGVSVNPNAASLASSAKKAKEESNKALHEEFKEQEAYNEILEDTLEQKRKTKRNTIIWITVMVVLCMCMIGVSVMTAFSSKNADESTSEQGSTKEEKTKEDTSKI